MIKRKETSINIILKCSALLILLLVCNNTYCQNNISLNSIFKSNNQDSLEKYFDNIYEKQRLILPMEFDSITEIFTLLYEEIILESYIVSLSSLYMGGQYKAKYLILQCRVPYFITDTFPNFDSIQTRGGIQAHYSDFISPVHRDTLTFYPSPLITDQFFLYLTNEFEKELSEYMGRENYDENIISESKREFLLQDSLIQPFHYIEYGQVDCDNRFWTFAQQPLLICVIFSRDLNKVQIYAMLHDNEVIITLFEKNYSEYIMISKNSVCYNCD